MISVIDKNMRAYSKHISLEWHMRKYAIQKKVERTEKNFRIFGDVDIMMTYIYYDYKER
jgi:hypothetical protein